MNAGRIVIRSRDGERSRDSVRERSQRGVARKTKPLPAFGDRQRFNGRAVERLYLKSENERLRDIVSRLPA